MQEDRSSTHNHESSSETSSTITGGALFISSSLIQSITQLVITLVVSLWLTPADFGIYSILYSLAFILLVLADFGIGRALVILVPRDEKNESRLIIISTVLKILFGIVWFVAFVIIIQLWFLPAIELQLSGLLIGFSYIIIEQVSLLIYWIFRIHKKMRYEATIRIINSIIGMTFLLLLNYIFGPSLFINAVAISIIPFINLFARYFFLRALGLDLKLKLISTISSNIKPILAVSYIFGIWAVFSLGFNQGIVILVGLIQGEIAAAVYRVSYTLVGFIALLVTALWAVFYPALSNYVAKKKDLNFRILFINILKVVLFFSFIVISIYWLFSDYIIALIYGTKYFGVEATSRVLSIAIFFQIVYTPYEIALATLNNQRSNTAVLIISVLLSFALTIMFTFFFGVFSSFAAAISVVLAQLSHFIILLIISRSRSDPDFLIPVKWGLVGLSFTLLIFPIEFLRILTIPLSLKLLIWLLVFLVLSFSIRLVSLNEFRSVLQIMKATASSHQ